MYNTDLGLMRRKTTLQAIEWTEAKRFFFSLSVLLQHLVEF